MKPARYQYCYIEETNKGNIRGKPRSIDLKLGTTTLRIKIFMHFCRNDAAILGRILVVISQIIHAYKLWPSSFTSGPAPQRNYYRVPYGYKCEVADGVFQTQHWMMDELSRVAAKATPTAVLAPLKPAHSRAVTLLSCPVAFALCGCPTR